MKSRTRGAFVIAFFLLLVWAWAAAQTTPPMTPFSADMEFTTTRGQGAGHDVSGKIYVSGDHMRMDITGGARGGAVIITNVVTKVSDTLLPEQHMYMEFNAEQMQRAAGMGPDVRPLPDPNNPCANQPGTTCKNLGVEQVNGRSCDHWQITDKSGKVGNVWIDQKIHFPIKTVAQDSTWVLTNIKEGAPEASLFEIPAGYQKMDLGGMMQGMHPPQQ
jgi:hypothetical protein